MENVKVFIILCEEPGPLRESTGVSHKVDRERDHGQGPLLWFLLEGKGETGQAGLGQAGLNHFSGLWGVSP